MELVESVIGSDLIDEFDEASKAGIVIEEPGGRYRFNHAIVRQSLLAELASVRRMRLHQRIAATLETQPGADDELLAELAHHYFECAWAGNAVKAVEYCRRAADQAMARLAYEGAADLYDHALHALEEIDDELPDRDDQVAELLLARCEALLAAGDVASAAGAVSQLQAATVDSARLAAWATCFDGQLSMLIHPERLDEVEAALAAAAEKLAELDDAAGEATAHTVRAACLGRLGRIGDGEIALDDALTAARRAREHRRVNAVLAGAPLAALWGPNPVPRAGGRCLDVVRLLRITTDSPAVEATSTRCQAILEAFRGRAAPARRMIDSARRTVTELGLRHALAEVEQFAGIVELVIDDPAAAEPHLRKAYNGFRRMGLDADTAETAALLGRACLALDREAEADELCTESERLAGHALKASIAWRTLRAKLLARRGDHAAARRIAEAAVALAERTDALVDHGDACLTLAGVLGAAGDIAGARAAAERAVSLYERKGAAALAEKARLVLDEPERPTAPAPPEAPAIEPDNACVRTIRRVKAVIDRKAWDELERLFAPDGMVESRRKMVGFTQNDLSGQWLRQTTRLLETGDVRLISVVVIAVRGERLALAREVLGSRDESLGAPYDELLHLIGIDEDGRIAMQVFLDLEDMEAALAELDAAHAKFEMPQQKSRRLENAATRTVERFLTCLAAGDWPAMAQMYADEIYTDDRRRVVAAEVLRGRDINMASWRAVADIATNNLTSTTIATRGERLTLSRVHSPTFQTEVLSVVAVDGDDRILAAVVFDPGDFEAAVAELDASYLAGEAAAHAHTWSLIARAYAGFNRGELPAMTQDLLNVDHRCAAAMGPGEAAAYFRASWELAAELNVHMEAVHRLNDLGAVCTHAGHGVSRDGFEAEWRTVEIITFDGDLINRIELFDEADIDAAIAKFDQLSRPRREAQIEEVDNACVRAGERVLAAMNRNAWDEVERLFAPEPLVESRRKVVGFTQLDLASGSWPHLNKRVREKSAEFVARVVPIAVRGERLALARLELDTADTSPGEPHIEFLCLYGIDEDGRIALQVFFDIEDTDAAIAELDAAHARFQEPLPKSRRLENVATRVYDRAQAHFAAHDWDAFTAILADDAFTDDRRRVVGSGFRQGQHAEIEDLRAAADLGMSQSTATVIATRGERLILTRTRYSGRGPLPQAYQGDVLHVIEVDASQRISAVFVFDPDDFGAAIAELETRYLAGEAAAHARTWSVIAGTFASVSQGELPAMTPDCVTNDHRRVTAFAPGAMTAYIRAGWDIDQTIRTYAEVVHRLSDLGAVCTYAAHGVSREGFEGEWRGVNVATVEGNLVNCAELFDEADVDAAVARFEQLSRPAPRLESAAIRVCQRIESYLVAGDLGAVAESLADNIVQDDRRRLVGGLCRGRAAVMTEISVVAAGVTRRTTDIIATRGGRLVLNRVQSSFRDERPDAFGIDVLDVIEIDADERVVARVVFDLDDFDAAIAELETRYLAGEAAAYAHTWSVITQSYASLNRRELPPTTPDWVNVDHRRGTSFAPSEMTAYIRASWNLSPDITNYIEAVHQLNNLGTVVTNASHGSSHEGFNAEWRGINIFTVAGDVLDRCEVFDEADIDAALETFEQLSRPAPRLENAATGVWERFRSFFDARDWDAMAEIYAEDHCGDDRRRITGSGVRRGRVASVENMRVVADFVEKMTVDVIAIRGERLALARARFWGLDQQPQAFLAEMLCIVESNFDDRLSAFVAFDPDDVDAAFAELDARYLAGEAAAHAGVWSVITGGFAALKRHELPPTTVDFVDIDHRRATAFGPGELMRYLRAGWEANQETRPYVEVVHRLTDLGAVVTYAARLTSRDGFEGEWRGIAAFTVEGDTLNRFELFDEADLDAAIAKFEQLSRPARRLENTASQMADRVMAHFTARDWDATAELLTDDFCFDDRRRTVNAGFRSGRDAAIQDGKANAEVGVNDVTSTVVATRGERLVLRRARYSGGAQRPRAFYVDALTLYEINGDGRLAAVVNFDIEDTDAAFAELDARYLAGEAAAHARTWSVMMAGHAALNRRELPPLAADCVSIDHRRGATFAPGEVIEYLHAGWDLDQEIRNYVEVVHRLSDLGAVCTHVAHGVSREGFEAEWRGVDLSTAEGDMVNRFELFDEADLDAAIARFDELSLPAPRLENAASRMADRVMAHFTARDWDAATELVANDFSSDDRRRTVNAGIQRGRDAAMKDAHANADVGAKEIASTVIATRGERLVLRRARYSGSARRSDAFYVDALVIYEINSDGRLAASVVFDIEDIEAAFEELETRYLAGEAAAYAHTWSAVTGLFAAIRRHEAPKTATDFASLDRRQGITFEPGGMMTYLQSVWELVPNINIYLETVHRLSDLGAVIAYAGDGESREGFDAEWRYIAVVAFDGDLLNRCELFDEANLEAALARFEEMHPPTPRLENAASQAYERYWTHFAARDWDHIAAMLADDVSTDDRRRVVNAGVRRGRDAELANMRYLAEIAIDITSTTIAVRGKRLALTRIRTSAFQTEALNVVEIDVDERIAAIVGYDLDDIDAAFAELETRYIAGEAAAHARTWSVIAEGLAGFNRREPAATTSDVVYIDRRPVVSLEGVELGTAQRAVWDLTPDANAHIAAVHRLSEIGAVITQVVTGTSQEGFDAEWRIVGIFTVEGDLLSRCEVFNEADIDAALTRFTELHPPTRRLENAAAQVYQRMQAYFLARDWDAMTDTLTEDVSTDDRRRVVGAGRRLGRDAVIAEISALAGIGVQTMTADIIAVRGDRLVLSRVRSSGRDQRPDAFRTDVLDVLEINADGRVMARVVFDPDEIDAAFAELDARYLAGEASAHSHTWQIITGIYATVNRHEPPPMTPDFVFSDHLPLQRIEAGDLAAMVRAMWDLTPDMGFQIEAVHRLSNLGGVVTRMASGTSQEGFYAEWRQVDLFTLEGDEVSRCEVFAETDVDAALARFEELHPPAQRLKSKVLERLLAHFAARDWDALAQDFAEDYYCDDRRRVVNAGVRNGRDAAIEDLRVSAEIGSLTNATLDIIATRGERFILTRWQSSGYDREAIQGDALQVVEHDGQRITAAVLFDLDDIDAAFAELDARYLAGEAAAHARTWSVIARECAAFNRHEHAANDYITIDHRRLPVIEATDPQALRAIWDVTPDLRIHIEAVHRLSGLRAVASYTARGTSPDGVDAEWRWILLLTVEGDRISRCEVFDEADLVTALARFDELHVFTRRPKSKVAERFLAHFAARDWDAMAQDFAEDYYSDDRRRVVNAGVRDGGDAAIEDLRVASDIGLLTNVTLDIIATRGERVILTRWQGSGPDHEAIRLNVLLVIEHDANERFSAAVVFDPDDIDAAFAELDARYLAGEGAAHAHTWSVMSGLYAGFNRHQLPATTPDWVYADHRSLVSVKARDLTAYITALWDQTQDISIYMETVHRLNNLGAVVTHTAQGISLDDFDAEWRMIYVFTVDGDLVSRLEVFEESDLDTALARFDELSATDLDGLDHE
ncbi:MAG TPA: hypothetical protein VMJ10_03625 [Kofleriaceae bacterium]|nr:hypothetical protein [Kofleriaceae bacterium]